MSGRTVDFQEEEKRRARVDPRFAGPEELEDDDEDTENNDDDDEEEEEKEKEVQSPRVGTDVDFDDESQVKTVLLKARPAVHAHLQALARKSSRNHHIKKGRPKHTTTHLSYHTKMLFTWKVLVTTKGTILSEPAIMKYLLGVVGLALGAGIVASLVVADPHNLSTATLFNIIYYVKLFLEFMLGLYLVHCVTRWWNSVTSITNFFHSIKTLVFFCNALDVNTASRDTIERFCMMSCYLLEIEISGFYSTDEYNKLRWASVKEFLLSDGLATMEELELLDKVEQSDRALLVWTWIGSILGSLQVPPPMKTTAVRYGHIAIESIKSVKFYVTMQLPFVYSHMLALLVHANNAIVAITSGIAITILSFDANHQVNMDRTSKVYGALQGISVQILYMMLQPAVYNAFLTVGALLADPFTNETHGLPMLDYVQDLRRRIGEMNALATCDAKWITDNTSGSEFHAAKSQAALTVNGVIAAMRKERQIWEAKETPSMVKEFSSTRDTASSTPLSSSRQVTIRQIEVGELNRP